MTPRMALVGANGYGVAHRRVAETLRQEGALRLVGLCDLAPVRDEPDAPVPPEARVFTDYREMLAATRPDLVVVATPPHTHLEIATAAARAGADLLVEKPPVLSLAEHHTLTEVLAASAGRYGPPVCQVGFQALGSAALTTLVRAISDGTLGRVRAVSAVGAWQRPDAYYQRAPWAGRRRVDGRQVLDGALVNPFAHALMQCLAIAAAAAGGPVWPVDLELERYRARPIEVDDTTVIRVRLDRGPRVVVAVTLCADEESDPEVMVHTDRGTAVLGYTTDRLRMPGWPEPRAVTGRTGLLANLLAHRRDGAPLLAPLARTAPFTAVAEAVAAAPVPPTIGAEFLADHGEGPQRVVTVPGVGEVLRRAAAELALPSELAVAWSAPPWRAVAPDASGGPQPDGGVQQRSARVQQPDG